MTEGTYKVIAARKEHSLPTSHLRVSVPDTEFGNLLESSVYMFHYLFSIKSSSEVCHQYHPLVCHCLHTPFNISLSPMRLLHSPSFVITSSEDLCRARVVLVIIAANGMCEKWDCSQEPGQNPCQEIYTIFPFFNFKWVNSE